MNKFVTQYIDSADYLVEKYFKKHLLIISKYIRK